MHKFFNSKDEKLTEKAFSQGLLVSVLSILLCIIALCSITYAWFVGESTSTGNTLVSGSFDLIITVTKDGTDYSVTEEANNDGVWICNFDEGGIYIVNLELKEGSSVKGHCLVKVGDDAVKHTDAIIKTDSTDNSFSFSITVTEGTVVTFEPRWGVVVEPDIEDDGVYPMPEKTSKEDDVEQEPVS